MSPLLFPSGACRCSHVVPGALLLVALLGSTSLRADWPQFRGPWGNGQANPPGDPKPLGVPLHWSETNQVKWKTPIPHRGWSTPVTLGERIWLTTATEDGHDFFVMGVDPADGKIVANEKVFHSDDPESLGNGASMNSYATPSPALEPGRLYAHFGSFGTACLDTTTARTLWKRDDLPCRHYRGPSSSVVLYENLVLLTFDGADRQYVAALDKQTGRTVWKTDRSVKWNDENVPGQMAKDGDLRKAHSTPLLATVGGRPQLISGGAKAAYGYDPRDGKELWRVQYADWSAAPVPLFEDGIAYLVSGFVKKELLAVRTDRTGDITETGIVWKLATHIGKYASPLLVDGLIYTAAEESFVTCLDAKNGQVVWTERIGGKYAASPICADGRLYFPDQSGVMRVLKPGRTFQLLAENRLDTGFMASPAVMGRSLLLRTRTHLYRVEGGE